MNTIYNNQFLENAFRHLELETYDNIVQWSKAAAEQGFMVIGEDEQIAYDDGMQIRGYFANDLGLLI